MKILYCATGLQRGGAEAQVVALACQLKLRGHDLCVVSLTGGGENWPELAAANIRVVSLGIRRGRPSPFGFLQLVRLWREFRPDVVHAHMIHANVAVRLARLFGTPAKVICTAHSIHEGGFGRRLLYRLTDPLSDLTTNVSRAAVAAYKDKGIVPSGRLTWVPNGIEMSRFCFPAGTRAATRHSMGWGDDEFVWFAAGRLVEAKDYPNMIRAFAHIAAAGVSGWRLVIAGDGPLRAEIERQVNEAGLGPRISLLGLRSDVPTLMNAADGYVMASAWEGLPMVLLEAAALGLPVVATQVGGNAEIVLPGRTGSLVPPRDAVALGAALAALLKADRTVRSEMGAAGRAYVAKHYDLHRIVGLWEKTYAAPVSLLARTEVMI